MTKVSSSVVREVSGIVHWYQRTAYGRWEGPGTVPFFADAKRVGRFAVDPSAIATRDPAALFRLLILLASYQSRRDVDIMAIQRGMLARDVRRLTSPREIRALVTASRCPHLSAAEAFDQCCDVSRDPQRGRATCGTRPRSACHVKDATMAIGRMGDMGKLATSAWLHLGDAGVDGVFREACRTTSDPHARAHVAAQRIASIYRIGPKLAAMFVSAISVPALYGVAPWFPCINGERLLVIDGNVRTAIELWCRSGRLGYGALAAWLGGIATKVHSSDGGSELGSPRMVQQAIYVFRSRSNRVANRDVCAEGGCSTCPSAICPFFDGDKRKSESVLNTAGPMG